MIFRILIIFIILAYLTIKPYKGNKWYCVLVTIAFTLIAGLRARYVGVDTPSYVYNFLTSEPLTFESFFSMMKEREPLYYIMQSLIHDLTGSYTVFFFVIAIFYNYCISKLIYKYSKNPSLSYLLFLSMGYFFFSMTGLRATMAMGFMYLATDAIIEKKYVKAVVFMVLSYGFHITSLFFDLIFLIALIPSGYMFVILVGIASVIIYSTGGDLVLEMINRVWEDTRSYNMKDTGTMSTLLLLILIAIAVLIIYRTLFDSSKKKLKSVTLENGTELNLVADRLFYKMLLFSIPTQILTLYSGHAFRLALMYHFSCMIIVPNTIADLEDKQGRMLGTFIVGLLVLAQFFLFTNETSGINPYGFFWKY